MIHQAWLGNSIPQQIREWMNGWRHYEGYRLWRDADLACYSDYIHAAGLDGLHPVWQNDLHRLLILRDHGGWYLDTDCERLGEMPALDRFSCRYTDRPSGAVMFAPPGDPAIVTMIERGMGMNINISAMERFGSQVLGTVAVQHLDTSAWCKHHALQSWHGSHQSKPISLTNRRKP